MKIKRLPMNVLACILLFTVHAVATPPPPVWTANPLALADAKSESAYHVDVAPSAVDPDGGPLTFSLLSGPAWLAITPAGIVFGTPGKSNEGNNEYVAQACNGMSCSQTTLRIWVVAR